MLSHYFIFYLCHIILYFDLTYLYCGNKIWYDSLIWLKLNTFFFVDLG